MPEKEVVVVQGGSIEASTDSNGRIEGAQDVAGDLAASAGLFGEVAGSVNEVGELVGSLESASSIPGVANTSGDLAASSKMEDATGASLTLRPGIDGADGKDGFSPTIEVHKDTKTEYVLRITDVNGSYLTPNLYPDLEGLQDIPTLVASKVDEDLLEYPVIDPKPLSITQRENTYLYTNSMGVNGKFALSEFALAAETDEKIRTKLQTVENVPNTKEWRIGDYILLDFVPKDIE